ncbi:MAG: hypothetical protein ACRD2C_25810 [Acidimicrobiales bacterium]
MTAAVVAPSITPAIRTPITPPGATRRPPLPGHRRPAGRTRHPGGASFLHTFQGRPKAPNGPPNPRRPLDMAPDLSPDLAGSDRRVADMAPDLSPDLAGGDQRVADMAVDLVVELSPDPDPTPPPTARPRPTRPPEVGHRRQLGTRRHAR